MIVVAYRQDSPFLFRQSSSPNPLDTTGSFQPSREQQLYMLDRSDTSVPETLFPAGRLSRVVWENPLLELGLLGC